MVTRRNTLIGLGILTAGGTGAVATGAFSAATAERNVEVGLEGDASAVVGLESTSLYTVLEGDDDDELGFNFQDLNRSSRFTFNDVFVIRNNNPNQTIRLTDIGSNSEESGEWNFEDDQSESPANVLVAQEIDSWQGNVPDQGNIDENSEWTFTGTETEYSTDGYDLAVESDDLDGDGIEIPSESFLAMGFQFGYDDFSDWEEDDIPAELRLTFDTLDQE